MLNLGAIDAAIIVLYVVSIVAVGFYVSRRNQKGLRGYFLGSNGVSWPVLGVSNASGMFDIAGTMWMVYLLYVYGLKSVWIPWLWPVFFSVFAMVYMAAWVRRSGKLTGAEWVTFRFGDGTGARVSHMAIVFFAIFNVVGFLSYAFVGVGKFIAIFFEADFVTMFSLEMFLPDGTSALPLGSVERELAYNTLNEKIYGILFVLITALYVVKGGLRSVVFTEVLQFFIMTIACVFVAWVAMSAVTAEQIRAAVPEGWDSLWFGWELDLDWSQLMPAVDGRIAEDGYNLFTIFMMLIVFKGLIVSFAGPAPNFDMQRLLATRSPVDAAKMSGMLSFILFPARYLMITGLTVLALVYMGDDLAAMGGNLDFEQILPLSMERFMPPVLLGILIAALISAFMSTFAAFLNSAPAYIVNDLYKKYAKPEASDKHYVNASYIVSVALVFVSLGIGLILPSVNSAILWIVSALAGGFGASNLLKFYWWRFNGWGQAAGMITGLVAAAVMPFLGWPLLNAFPLLLAVCLGACLIATFATKPTEMQVLEEFYIKTRPWGFWGPVIESINAKREKPIKVNRNFATDMGKIAVGIVWQTALTAAPVFFVIKSWTSFGISVAVIAVCTWWLKIHWWDTLEEKMLLDDLEESHASQDPRSNPASLAGEALLSAGRPS